MQNRSPFWFPAKSSVLATAFFTGTLQLAALDTIELRTGLAMDATGRPGRNAVFADALEARFADGNWTPPTLGQSLLLSDGTTNVWRIAQPDAEGWFSGSESRGGSVWLQAVLKSPATYILEAQGHALAYVNGEPRAGDPYAYGYAQLPVSLHAGTNHFVLTGIRGRAKARLVAPTAPVAINPGDMTLPDLVENSAPGAWGAAIVVNSTTEELRNWTIECQVDYYTSRVPLPSIPPLSIRKVPFRIQSSKNAASNELSATLTLLPPKSFSQPLGAATPIRLRVRRPDQSRKITFHSRIDGSIQYYALQPATDIQPPAPRAGLVLSLHGASVEAIGQADAYAPKSGLHIVCPTNRRPYGFDWEEWGRMDALEVLHRAQNSLGTDPQRVYLTGHSMGGHGTWNLGVTFPGHFAAIAPSAGWISFASYVGGRSPKPGTNAMDRLMQRAAASSDTLGLATNYLSQSIYILHGDADDNVPVTQARTMRAHLSSFHPDVGYFEQPGAGHWWDGPLGGGADCVDWPPMFDLFQKRRLPDPIDLGAPASVRFVTVNPGVSSKHHWVTVEAQLHPLLPSEVHATKLSTGTGIAASTRNIQRLSFALSQKEASAWVSIDLDGQQIALQSRRELESGRVAFELQDGHWRLATKMDPTKKNPQRSGSFKEAFQHQMVFVYATHGTPSENRWARSKAQFDAEAFWYRGNGAVDIVSDSEFTPRKYAHRGVVLYGHRDSNSAWVPLLETSPIQVRRGSIQVGGKTLAGQDLACVFLRPRTDSDRASVAVVSGSGDVGQRLTNRLPYFLAGTGFPDWMILDHNLYLRGVGGIVGAGFFDNSWKLAPSESEWHH